MELNDLTIMFNIFNYYQEFMPKLYDLHNCFFNVSNVEIYNKTAAVNHLSRDSFMTSIHC